MDPEKKEQWKKKISSSLKGKMIGPKNPMYGKHRSEELKQKLREYFTGKKHTEETKKKMSESHKGHPAWNKGRCCPNEVREKISLANKGKHAGEKNPMFGKHMSEKTKQKLKEINKIRIGKNHPMFGKHHSDEWKKHPSWKGGIQKNKKDCIHIWAGTNKRLRRPREIYKEHFGNIPKGYVIYHKNGKMHDDRPDNLIAISRTELLKINNGTNWRNFICQ